MQIIYEKYALLLLQIIAHISLIYAIFNFEFYHWIISFFVYFITGCLGISITYHRYLSHRSWKPPSWWIYIGSFFGLWGAVGSPLAWANNHIEHHRHVDTDKDPHSPSCRPFWKVQWFSMLYASENFRVSRMNLNKFQIFLHRYYYFLHLIIFLSLYIIFGLHVLVMVYLTPAAILWNMSSLVNTINHLDFGYRNYNLKDRSSNNLIIGYLTFGEGWHNNHHAYPGKFNFGVQKWEFDISSKIIKIIERL